MKAGMISHVYTVTAVNRHISTLFQADQILSDIYVRGELSNVKYASSGHIYFTLKDEKSQIHCAMWSSRRGRLNFFLRNGDNVIVSGQISVYERDGTYQLYAEDVRQAGGVGALYEKFEALKQKLFDMGMFDDSYKKPIPAYVRTLGVVTSEKGAALRDIINVSRRRDPGIQIILYPATVQGEGAADTIVEGIKTLDSLQGVDVIIVGRGGGSIEDLWAFNEEKVAYAIFNCTTPVISAVGHETDTTIADFVADKRAPTPSAGAELAVQDVCAVLESIHERSLRISRLMRQIIERKRHFAEQYGLKLRLYGPSGRVQSSRHFLAQTQEKMIMLITLRLKDKRSKAERYAFLLNSGIKDRLRKVLHRYELLEERIRALSPQTKLDGGYAYLEDSFHHRVSSVLSLRVGDALTVCMKDGSADTEVRRITFGDRPE